jgi:membrane protease YdiL (CAAX protease family)
MLLWLAYTALQTVYVLGWISETWNAFLGILPGLLGVSGLLVAGFRFRDCYLQWKSVSRRGVVALLFSTILLLPVLTTGTWRGWSPIDALVYAPASGISQELFFRAVLLPSLLFYFQGKLWSSLLVHSTLFGLWHLGPIFMGAPLWAALAVMVVPFLGGLAWGWQVQRDQTVVWAKSAHILILIATSFFSWG